MKVYKIPNGITREDLIKIVGTDKSLMNPTVDKNGVLCISKEEFNSPEFQKMKETYAAKLEEFVLIDYAPREFDIATMKYKDEINGDVEIIKK